MWKKFYHIKQLKQVRSSQNTRCIFNQIIHTLHIHNVFVLLLALSHECRFQAADEHALQMQGPPLVSGGNELRMNAILCWSTS